MTNKVTSDEDVKTEETEEVKPSPEAVALSQLMGDSDIQKVIQAKKEGTPIEVLLKSEQKDTRDDEDLIDEDLSDEDKRLTGQVLEIFVKKIDPIIERLKNLEGLADNLQEGQVQSLIASARKKFPDFNSFGKEMAAISKEHPGLPVEELYVIAKSRKGDLNFSNSETFSEKPTPEAARTIRREEVGTEPSKVRGRKGFSSNLRKALENIEIDV